MRGLKCRYQSIIIPDTSATSNLQAGAVFQTVIIMAAMLKSSEPAA